MKIAVMGSGGWGTALVLVLLESGHEVTLWSYREEESTILWEKRENPISKGAPLPNGPVLTSGRECVKNCKVVVLVTPSFAVCTIARAVVSLLEPSAVLVSVSKGIEKDISLTLIDTITQEVGEEHLIVVLSGPPRAEEVGRGVLTVVVSASRDKAAAKSVQSLFMSEWFCVYASDDVVGVELGAALKNTVALCAGICGGMGFGGNTKAALIIRGLTEIARLGVASGDRREILAELSGVGDLIVTCTSIHPRNRRCGTLIGQGTPAAEAVKETGVVVESRYAAATARALTQKAGVEMPITEVVCQVSYGGRDTGAVTKELMTCARKYELENSRV